MSHRVSYNWFRFTQYIPKLWGFYKNEGIYDIISFTENVEDLFMWFRLVPLSNIRCVRRYTTSRIKPTITIVLWFLIQFYYLLLITQCPTLMSDSINYTSNILKVFWYAENRLETVKFPICSPKKIVFLYTHHTPSSYPIRYFRGGGILL